MPVVPAILGDDILVRSKGVVYGESLTYQFLCKRPLDLYRNNLTGTSVRAGNINFGNLRRYDRRRCGRGWTSPAHPARDAYVFHQ